MRPHPRDRERLEWMAEFEHWHGLPPTLEDIRRHEDWASRSSADLLVRRLQREGHLDSEGRVVEGSLA